MGTAARVEEHQVYVPPGPVAAAFHRSNAFVRGLMGSVGSGKSSSCWMELFTRACEQKPNGAGVRRTRAAVVRNTYSELKSTTIKTVLEWSPYLQIRWDAPITGRLKSKLSDGTSIDLEVLFIALERPEDIDKIGSLELTFAWANEVREVAKPIIDKLTERVGRFPPKKDGGPTWRGVVMDTNPPDDDHWYYGLAEKADEALILQTESAEHQLRKAGFLRPGEPLFEFFRQPGGLMKVGGQYVPNPAAENVAHLDGGHAYYLRQLAGKREEWIRAQLCGEYATITDGRPVYPEYNDQVHCMEALYIPRLPLLVGLDYGRTPAAVFGQLTARGQLRFIDELWGEDIGLEAFASDVIQPHIAMHYPKADILFYGDPAGMAKESDERTAFDVLAEAGIVATPAHTNRITGRLEAVRHYLSRMVDGQPALVVDPKCIRLRKGFIGRYYFRRVQTSGETYKDMPEKNEVSHCADAAQYLALAARMENLSGGKFREKIKYPSLGVV